MATTSVPTAVGIILDGNRRWAASRGLPKLEGHRKGLETLREAVRFIRARGVSHLAVFLFSTENWERDPEEVQYLMGMAQEVFEKEMEEIGKEGVRIRIVGQRERFSEELQRAFAEAEEKTKSHTDFTLWCCLSYGGRAEIAEAARAAARAGVEVTEGTIGKYLWSADMPDLDILIRTGGEQRLSGFLTWKSIYAELFFIETYWPDFNEASFDRILEEYAARERRFGR